MVRVCMTSVMIALAVPVEATLHCYSTYQQCFDSTGCGPLIAGPCFHSGNQYCWDDQKDCNGNSIEPAEAFTELGDATSNVAADAEAFTELGDATSNVAADEVSTLRCYSTYQQCFDSTGCGPFIDGPCFHSGNQYCWDDQKDCNGNRIEPAEAFTELGDATSNVAADEVSTLHCYSTYQQCFDSTGCGPLIAGPCFHSGNQYCWDDQKDCNGNRIEPAEAFTELGDATSNVAADEVSTLRCYSTYQQCFDSTGCGPFIDGPCFHSGNQYCWDDQKDCNGNPIQAAKAAEGDSAAEQSTAWRSLEILI